MKHIPLFFGLVLFVCSTVLAGPDCPESKPPPQDVMTAIPGESAPAPSSPSATSPAEPSSTKEQMGLTFDPTIPDKSIFEEEKNPERKKLLDKIFEAKTKEVNFKVRLDELARLQKDCGENIRKIFDENQKLLKQLDNVIERKRQTSIFRSLEPLNKESDRIWRELNINGERRKKLEEQEQRYHHETLSMINKEGEAFIERVTLEESLGRMDAKQDAKKASIPKLGR